ncbi:MAG TPA: hypothetical protein VGB64_14105 [Actinomycetota bacterium]
MKRFLMAGLIAGAVLSPGAVFASHGGAGCGYATTPGRQEHVVNSGAGLVLYADTNGGGGTTAQADQSAGVCMQGVGTLEAGHGANKGSNRYAWHSVVKNGVYVVADGQSVLGPTLRGYIGVSNFETGSTSSCSGPQAETCTGSNGGGWFGPAGGVGGQYAYPVPIICGDDTGPNWDDSRRDGCRLS